MITKIAPEKAHRLLTILKKHMPLTHTIFNTLATSLIYRVDFNTFYTKEKSSSLVAATDRHPLTNVQSLNIFWDPHEHSDEEVHDFLVKIPTLQWGQPIYLQYISDSISDNIGKILSSSELIGGKLKKIRRDIDLLGFKPKDAKIAKEIFGELPNELSADLEEIGPELKKKIKKNCDEFVKSRLPENMEMSSLRESNLSEALSMWYQRPVDPKNFAERFRKLPSRAIYKKGQEGSSALVSFFFLTAVGLPTAGYTAPDYRRSGLSLLVIADFHKDIIKSGLYPLGSAVKGRDDVIELLGKFGMGKVSDVFHEIHYSPDDPSVIIPYY